MKRFKTILFVIVIVASFIGSLSCYAQESSIDVVYLKNGSIIYGTIIELTPNQKVSIRTRDGSVFVFELSDVEKIVKENTSTNTFANPPAPPNTQISNQFALNRAQRQKNLGIIGLGVVYGLTIVGDLAAGEPFYTGSAIPVIGPAIAMFEVIDDPYGSETDIVLFAVSGLLQDLALWQWIAGSRKEKRLKGQLNISSAASSKQVKFALTYKF